MSRKLLVAAAELNLEVVLLNGQSFRWSKSNHNSFPSVSGVAYNRVWNIRRCNEHEIEYEVLGRFGFVDDLKNSTESDESALRKYFQLDVDLQKLYVQWSVDKYFSSKLTKNEDTLRGIRLIQQEPLECVFAFICSANNNIQRITKMVNKLCQLYGDSLTLPTGDVHHNFPTLNQLHANVESMEAVLRKEGFGYRAGYIAQSVQKLHNLGGESFLEALKLRPYAEAHEILTTELTGVGPKVADCICLMSLGKTEVVPVDVHVFRLTAENYLSEMKKRKAPNAEDRERIRSFFIETFGDYAGWAQSVLFTAQLRQFGSPTTRKAVNSAEPKGRKRRK